MDGIDRIGWDGECSGKGSLNLYSHYSVGVKGLSRQAECVEGPQHEKRGEKNGNILEYFQMQIKDTGYGYGKYERRTLSKWNAERESNSHDPDYWSCSSVPDIGFSSRPRQLLLFIGNGVMYARGDAFYRESVSISAQTLPKAARTSGRNGMHESGSKVKIFRYFACCFAG